MITNSRMLFCSGCGRRHRRLIRHTQNRRSLEPIAFGDKQGGARLNTATKLGVWKIGFDILVLSPLSHCQDPSCSRLLVCSPPSMPAGHWKVWSPLGEMVAVISGLRGGIPGSSGVWHLELWQCLQWTGNSQPRICPTWLVSGKMCSIFPCTHLLILLSLSRYDAGSGGLWLELPSTITYALELRDVKIYTL